MNFYASYQSPLGPITMASDGDVLIGLWFDGQKYDRSTLGESAVENVNLPIFEQVFRWLDSYFSGEQPDFIPPLKINGSHFKQMVSEIMLSIPYGATMTYGDIANEMAKRMGKKSMSAQAVGGAVSHNAISIIVPCHRVMGSNGSLTGYAGGIHRKKALLNIEHLGVL